MSEKVIQKVVGILMLLFGAILFFFNIKSGYTSFGTYFIPLIFILVSMFVIFKDTISTLFTKASKNKAWLKPKKMIEMNLKFVFVILPLSIFLLLGFALLYFAIKFPTNVGVVGWITIVLFILVPIIVIYGFIFGFSVSEKRQKQIEDRLNSVSANDAGISLEQTIFDTTCFINWNSIDAIVYYNFYVSSDFTEYYEGYKFYLNERPLYTKYERQWWLNKLFPKNATSKIIDIKVDTKNFCEIPKMIENYLNAKTDIDFKPPLKGTLISSEVHQSKNKTTTIEKWKPNKDEREQIVFNKLNVTMEELNTNYR